MSLPLESSVPAVPNIYLTASGKGGVGKTWFSISFAQGLAQKGKKVLLFDGDLGLANVDIQLGLTPEKDLGGVLQGLYTLEEAVFSYEAGGFDIIAGRSGCGSLASPPPQRLLALREALRLLAPKYDVVLIDLGAGIGGIVRHLSTLAQECFIIVTDEPTSLTDAYAFIKVNRLHQPDLHMNVVVNQSESRTAGERTYQILNRVCENFLKMTPPFCGIIRRDAKVREAIRSQTPLLIRHPSSEAALDLNRIIEAFNNR